MVKRKGNIIQLKGFPYRDIKNHLFLSGFEQQNMAHDHVIIWQNRWHNADAVCEKTKYKELRG